jgi:regulator of replication initiation timing
MMDNLQCPPLPADLETAHKELRYWQRQVIVARQQVAKMAEKRELDKRSARGNIKSLMQENDNLRKEIKALRARLVEYAIKDRL